MNYRHMILPARSVDYWSQWSSVDPPIDCALGTLSPQLTDGNSHPNSLTPQLSKGDVISVSCQLNPQLFQNNIPEDQAGRSAWTVAQRGKAESCPALNTVSELSDWVSSQRVFRVGFLTICKQLNGLPISGKTANRVYRRLESTFNDRLVLFLCHFLVFCSDLHLSENPFTP